MAVISYEDVTPTPIANTTVKKMYSDGVHKVYVVAPVEGYVLHDNMGCWTDIDPVTGEEVVKHSYYIGSCTCRYDYDFTANPREFYAVPTDSVPADQIFGGGDNNHEVM